MTIHKEVELTVKVTKNVFDDLKKRLATLATAQGTITQEDVYLDNPTHSFFSKEKNEKQISLRIRHRNDGDRICLKVAHHGTDAHDYYRDEYELKIDSPEKALSIFSHLGYQVVIKLKKQRSSFTYGDYEIMLDEMSGATPDIIYMVEIESKIHVDDHVAAIHAMEKFLRETLHVTTYEKLLHGIAHYV